MPAPKKHKPYKGCETGGRPVKYTKEFIEKEADAFIVWMQVPLNFYFKEFATSRGYHPNRLQEFAEQNEKFSGAYKMAQALQEIKVVKGGMMNAYNSSITKFVLANCHGWSDKQQLSGDAANPLGLLLKEINGSSKELCEDE